MYVPGKLMTDLQMSFCVKSRQSWHNDKKLRSFAVSCRAECPFQHNVTFFLEIRTMLGLHQNPANKKYISAVLLTVNIFESGQS